MTPNVLIAGAYGTGNLGDEAILAGLLEELRSGDSSILVFSRDPEETTGIHGVAARRRNASDLRRARRLLIGGGELFQPGMAWKYATLILAARSLGKPVDVRAVGVSRKLSGWERALTARALKVASHVRVRDERSAIFCKEMGVEATVEPDPSERLKPDPSLPEGIQRRLTAGSPKIGLNLRGTYDPARDAVIAREIDTALSALRAAKPEARIIFLPFTRHKDRAEERDDNLGHALAARHPGLVDVLDEPLTPRQMLGVIQRLDLVVTMRFHPAVFAHVVGTPAVVVREYWKVEEFARTHGFPVVEATEVAARLVT